jgi:hypothetical protein
MAAPLRSGFLRSTLATSRRIPKGVVCVLFSGGTEEPLTLVATAGACGKRVTLEPFAEGKLEQLWAYKGVEQSSYFLNLGNACMLDLYEGDCGEVIQTWSKNDSDAQTWTARSPRTAAAHATADPVSMLLRSRERDVSSTQTFEGRPAGISRGRAAASGRG